MSSEQNPAIETKNLTRRFGELVAVQDVNLAVRVGEVFSLLGPNGAGKSTTISMICGLLAPTSGEVNVMGYSVRSEGMKARACLGVVPQEVALYPDLSARENLVFWGKMYGLRGKALNARVDELLKVIGLAERQKDRVSTYSGGMKRRVNIAVALLHKPPIVILDEPTVGIDPQSRRHILDNVKELNRQGTTVLYTTHYMEEAQELSSRIAVMDKGKLIACGTQEELIRLVGEKTQVDLTLNTTSEPVVAAWRGTAGVSQASLEPDCIRVLVDDSNVVLPHLFEAATRLGARITSVDIKEPSLETVFLLLTGRALRD
jgi:ABC-2 type transport system ATP-binding protein